MLSFKNLLFIILYTLLLTSLMFLAEQIFFGYPGQEEIYIEPQLGDDSAAFDAQTGYYSFSGTKQEDINAAIGELLLEQYEQTQEQESQKIALHYIPGELQKQIELSHIPLIQAFFSFTPIGKTIERLGVFFYESSGEVRGRMKSQKIHIFGANTLPQEEFLSVFIHEFGHYYDIYSLKKNNFGDESQKFYDISWESQNRMKKQLGQNDFVSGYAMTNQYEDFAESYVYYVLHNRDFYSRSETSGVLREKYNFFETYVFTQKEFYKEAFSQDAEPKSYYWDITKISVDVKKFLQYLQNEI